MATAVKAPPPAPADTPLGQLQMLCDPGTFRPLRSGVSSLRLGERATPGDGVAAGAGLSLALACDLRYVAASARLVLAFVRIGLVPDAGSMYFLPRLVGPGKALEMAWTGDPLSADEALAAGMVNKVLPDEQVLSATQELAARLSHGPARTLGLIKICKI